MLKLVGEQKKGSLFVVSAPAGTGKTTLITMLTSEFPSIIASISYTTRPPRKGEISGKDYHFVSHTDFLTKIENGDFLEYVQLYDFYYGTSRSWVKQRLEEGKHVVLVIDTQGALKIQAILPAISIFIYPPSSEALQNRLEKRETESEESIAKRLEWAQHELNAAKFYDYQIVNDNLLIAYQVFRSIFIAESHRVIQDEVII